MSDKFRMEDMKDQENLVSLEKKILENKGSVLDSTLTKLFEQTFQNLQGWRNQLKAREDALAVKTARVNKLISHTRDVYGVVMETGEMGTLPCTPDSSDDECSDSDNLEEAKVQRLYLKYCRAESFRKALSYQKRYLILAAQYEAQPTLLARSKTTRSLKVLACAVVAVVRMRNLALKYHQRVRASVRSRPGMNTKKNPKRKRKMKRHIEYEEDEHYHQPIERGDITASAKTKEEEEDTTAIQNDETELYIEDLIDMVNKNDSLYEPINPYKPLSFVNKTMLSSYPRFLEKPTFYEEKHFSTGAEDKMLEEAGNSLSTYMTTLEALQKKLKNIGN